MQYGSSEHRGLWEALHGKSRKASHPPLQSLTVFFSLWLLAALANPGHFLYPQSWWSTSSCQPASVSSQLAPAPTHAAATSPASPTGQSLRPSQSLCCSHSLADWGADCDLLHSSHVFKAGRSKALIPFPLCYWRRRAKPTPQVTAARLSCPVTQAIKHIFPQLAVEPLEA